MGLGSYLEREFDLIGLIFGHLYRFEPRDGCIKLAVSMEFVAQRSV